MRGPIARTFFKDDEKKAIDTAVAEAEKTTSGEIVPVLATRAAAYTHGLYHAALSAAFVATLAVVGAHFALAEQLDRDFLEIPIYVLLPAQLLALVLGYHAARLSPRVHRRFLPKALLQQTVEHAARRAFRDLGLAETQGATGIMIYVSLFERVAVVLADKGISAKHKQETWDSVRDIVLNGLATGHGAEGYTKAIGECGRILSRDFPPTAENPNELPNQLRVLA